MGVATGGGHSAVPVRDSCQFDVPPAKVWRTVHYGVCCFRFSSSYARWSTNLLWENFDRNRPVRKLLESCRRRLIGPDVKRLV